jgi:hypothetical protein
VDHRELWQSDDAPEGPALRSTAAEPSRGLWTRSRIVLAILLIIVWIGSVWLFTMWRFESIIGPPPDPKTLPKPP